MHKISQVVNSEYIQQVLEMAKAGKRFSELAEVLTDEETTIDETSEFIHNLIDVQLLVSELEPAVTHTHPLYALIEKLNGLPTTERQVAGILSEIDKQLVAIDSQPLGDSFDIYPSKENTK